MTMATKVLDLGVIELCRILRRGTDGRGQVNVEKITGFELLASDEVDQFVINMKRAVDRVRANPKSKAVDPYDLEMRLTTLTNGVINEKIEQLTAVPYAPSPNERTFCEEPWRERDIVETTIARSIDEERAHYQELIESGGRPAYPLEHLWCHDLGGTLNLRDCPWTNLLPLRADEQEGWRHQVYSRQIEAWWQFRKSQWIFRGLDQTEESAREYVTLCKSFIERQSGTRYVNSAAYETDMQQQWKRISIPKTPLGSSTFSGYRKIVTARLARHGFQRPIKLLKHPLRQTPWTNWLEYVAYAQGCLDQAQQDQRVFEEKFHDAVDTFRGGLKNSPGLKPMRELWPTRSPQRFYRTHSRETFKHDADLWKKWIPEFLRNTEEYVMAREDTLSAERLMNWTVEQARCLDVELMQADGRGRKRRLDDDDDTQLSDKGRNTRSTATKLTYNPVIGEPITSRPRRSKRLADKKTKK